MSELKEWNFDGSSTGQAEGHNSDVFLRPAAIFPDPFRGGDNILVMAETYNNDGTPNKFNHRYECAKTMEAAKGEEPWVSRSIRSIFNLNSFGTPRARLGYLRPNGPNNPEPNPAAHGTASSSS